MDDTIKRIWAASDVATREKIGKIIELYAKGMITNFEMHNLIHNAFMEGRKHDHGIH